MVCSGFLDPKLNHFRTVSPDIQGFNLQVICLTVVENNHRRHFDILFLRILVHYIHIVPSKYVSSTKNMLLGIQSIVTKLLKLEDSMIRDYIDRRPLPVMNDLDFVKDDPL